MPIFNSLGSNYDSTFIKLANSKNHSHSAADIEQMLEENYGAQATVMYKGRQALTEALRALNMPSGTHVAVNGYTCSAVYQAVVDAGYLPVYIDIEEKSLNYSAQKLYEAKQNDPEITIAIVQNTLGTPATIEEILMICQKLSIALVEDLAHSIGMKYEGGHEAGTIGHAAALSFSQDKSVDGVSGGALIWRGEEHLRIDRQDLSQKQLEIDKLYPKSTWSIRKYYKLGWGKFKHKMMVSTNKLSKPMDGLSGIAQNISDWHANLIAYAWLKKDQVIEHRKSIAKIYHEVLDPKVQFEYSENAIYLRFPIKVQNRAQLINHLKNKSVHVSDIWYDAPVAPKKLLNSTNYNMGQCPNAEIISNMMINLPTHINVSQKDAKRIAEEVNKWLVKSK